MSSEQSKSAEFVTESLPLSKNRLKKLKRDEAWEAGRDARKEKRKLKLKTKREKKREGHEASINSNVPGHSVSGQIVEEIRPKSRPRSCQMPVTFLIDCGYDDLMADNERKSLAAQVTRCYSENRRAPYRAHIGISSFHGPLKELFDGLLGGGYRSWKGFHFLVEEFGEAAEQAKTWMKGDQGEELGGVLHRFGSSPSDEDVTKEGEVVYLTSDSPNTLSVLQPHSVYILGGLVDHNRHKGICHKTAMAKGVRTAKLPIGDFMQMNSRFVLTVNQVLEILLRWLDVGDWGLAFLDVIPKRKGGVLKVASEGHQECDSVVQREENSQELVDDK